MGIVRDTKIFRGLAGLAGTDAATLSDAKRGDIVQVGKTKWIVWRPNGTFSVLAYKHPSKHKKSYEIRAESREGNLFAVWQHGGSGQHLTDTPETSGPASIIGHEPELLE